MHAERAKVFAEFLVVIFHVHEGADALSHVNSNNYFERIHEFLLRKLHMKLETI